jgi:hypothetical protein
MERTRADDIPRSSGPTEAKPADTKKKFVLRAAAVAAKGAAAGASAATAATSAAKAGASAGVRAGTTAATAASSAVESFDKRSRQFRNNVMAGTQYTTSAYVEFGKAVVTGGAAKDFKNAMVEFSDNVADAARGKVVDQVAAQFDAVVAKERSFVVDDPSLPRCIKASIETSWDMMLPNVREEFLAALESEVGLRRQRGDHIDHAPPNLAAFSTLRRCGHSARAKVLYALYPFDQTLWSTMRNPFWWILNACLACPFLGINSISFAILLCLIDRQDLSQLVNFVLVFKQYV